MKNYNKKLIVMFVMLLAVIGFGTIQNGTIANAATVGQQLTAPETGWTRYNDTDNRIQYEGTGWSTLSDTNWYNSNLHQVNVSNNEKVNFKFYGTKIRIIQTMNTDILTSIEVYIDGQLIGSYTNQNTTLIRNAIVFEKLGLELKCHTIVIKTNAARSILWDAVDIDGQLFPYNESISLNKSSIDLTEGTSQQLTATTTPSAVGVTWKSSNLGVATVDENGNVKGVAAGATTIAVTTTDGSNLSATCTVTVTPVPVEPTEPTGDGALYIELVNGNIKSYDVTATEITNFIKWYNNRDNDDSQSPYYQFTKGTYKDYVVHDKIDWFEVR